MKKYIVSIQLILLFLFSCRGENPKQVYREGIKLRGMIISIDSLGTINRGRLIVRDTVDLKGYTCLLPDGVLVDLTNGQIRNGELVGHNNELRCDDGSFFRVRISGEWNVPIIKSSFFSDISYDNAFCDIVALSNANVKNVIIVKEGEYQITINKPWQSCVTLKNNTELILNGVLRLTPNDFPGYKIINVSGNNIKIKGSGRIIGDKAIHTEKNGEWGMGINIENSSNIMISGISVESCWGDCLYVGNAERVIIQECNLKDSRRQGISITAANDVKVKKCRITGIKGTAPEFAIDVEPNKNDTCRNIKIDQVYISDCQGGILSWGGATGASVNTIKVRNCTLERIHKSPFRFDDVDNVTVEKCTVSMSGKRDPFTLINLRNFKKSNITVA